ncbi:MAG: carbohydrate-binding domain-containing protein [Oscillospiraceae bacterium]|nr:carbohydrate-binding domain-containing protein [Oscillospiraceae bacterium]
MKTMWKLTAALLSLSLLAGAVPFSAAAADEGTEPEVMTATVKLNETSATATGDNVTVDGSVITITASGSYEFSGTLTDGQINVNVPDTKKDANTVKLFFKGVTITGVNAPAVMVNNAKNTSINLVADTENFLYDGDNPYRTSTGLSFANNAVIFSKDDITIKGDGSLRIEATQNHGIHSNNDLKITGGKLKVKTTGTKIQDGDSSEKFADGIRGKESVQIKGGDIDINANGDGIKSTKGYVSISDGEIEVKASNDAIQAEDNIIKDGETIKAIEISGGRLKANGDRSLTVSKPSSVITNPDEAGETTFISITGGNVFATATDGQPTLLDATQPVLELNFKEEQLKDLELAISKDTETLFSRKSDKRFSFALISFPELTADTEYELTLDGKLIMANDVAVVKIKAENGVTVIDNVSVSAPEKFNGDIDGDGRTAIGDAILMCRYIAEDKEAYVSPEGIALMDFNHDTYVTSEDTQVLLCYLAGVI